MAHCPLSNVYFANAVLPVRRVMAAGVRLGLGTDIAGGAEAGLLHQCAIAVDSSRVLVDAGEPDAMLDAVTAFHLGTAGGADVLGLNVGRFQVGQQFDAIVVDTQAPGSALRAWDGIDDHDRMFEKIVRLARPHDIAAVWVAGR